MKGSCEECPDPLDCVELWFYIELVQFCVPEFVEVREVCGELKAEQTIHTHTTRTILDQPALQSCVECNYNTFEEEVEEALKKHLYLFRYLPPLVSYEVEPS